MGIALITGASAGIGIELAKLFVTDGHSVILVARRKERLEDIATQLKQLNSEIKTWIIDLDLSQRGAGKTLFEKVQTLGLEVEFLVNNAGSGTAGHFSQLPLARELQMMDLNMTTPLEVIHYFLPQMLKRRSGRILNVGSLAGFQAGPYMATYSATKAFVNSLSEALHEELKGTGVTCTVLAPGYTVTEFQQAANIKGMSASSPAAATPAAVARDGYNAMMRGGAMKVSGFLNNLSAQSLRLAPRVLVRKITARLYLDQTSERK